VPGRIGAAAHSHPAIIVIRRRWARVAGRGLLVPIGGGVTGFSSHFAPFFMRSLSSLLAQTSRARSCCACAM
jgi:hypothetical protein